MDAADPIQKRRNLCSRSGNHVPRAAGEIMLLSVDWE
jgi:hypothetical protein